MAAPADADLLRAHNQVLEGALKEAKSDACRLRFKCTALRQDVDALVAERDSLKRELYDLYGPQPKSQSVLVLLASDSEDSDLEEGSDDGGEGRNKRLCCRAG